MENQTKDAVVDEEDTGAIKGAQYLQFRHGLVFHNQMLNNRMGSAKFTGAAVGITGGKHKISMLPNENHLKKQT